MQSNRAERAPSPGPDPDETAAVYSPTARALHWIVAAGVAVLIPLGIVMSERMESQIGGPLTDGMYSTHKALGFTVLLLMVVRIAYRLVKGAPPDLASHTWVQRIAAHAVHWLLYALLIIVPLGGWIGVSYYGARDLFGIVSLPQITPVDLDTASLVLAAHKIGGWAILGLVLMHTAAALFHHLVLKDGVMHRILRRRSPGH